MLSGRTRSVLTGLFFSLILALPCQASEGSPMAHHMVRLVLQLGLILFVARFGGLLFQKILRLPAVLGELFAGIVIGPHLLGALAFSGFPKGLFPLSGAFPVSHELYGIATIASIILLFLAGLETDFNLFLRFSLTGSLVGLGGVIGSFIIGDLTAVLFAPLLGMPGIDFMHPSALFLGTISTATSVGITARILSEKRKMDTPEGVSILAGAVVDDVLGIILLAVVVGISSLSGNQSGPNWGKVAIIAAKALGFWLVATLLGMLAARRIGLFLKNIGRGSMASLALGFALLLAGLSEMAGLAMIIGAYIMGLSLSRTEICHEIQEKLASLYHFFVPVFFTVMGMLVDFTAFSSSTVILFGLIYSAGAIIAKLISTGLPALATGFNMRGALRIGIGMLPRGEVALIVAGIGLSTGLIPGAVFGVAVMMTLISTLIAPPTLVAVFNSPERGTRKEVNIQGEEIETISLDFSSEKTTSLMVENLTTTFRDEEFFVHLIDIESRVYSLRKENISLSLRHYPTRVEINCHRKHLHYIKFILSESILSVIEIVNEIREAGDLLDKPRDLLSS